ncbi:MAG TPA: hypothetical protein VK814_12495 [Acidobacteriaceae bacterium]|jgi:hypothetical protein|nr:hypothetical protein [Acidobacteriaceae bacterium]
MTSPVSLFFLSLILLWISERIGAALRKWRPLSEDARKDFDVILTAALTLLGLMIGFTFSMAVTRFDQRKNFEEAEANSIETEYLRADLLPAADADRLHQLLRSYLDQRIAFYRAMDARQIQQSEADTAQLQAALWAAVETPALEKPTPVAGLAVSGMNDVLISHGRTQFAWEDRIPVPAWMLLLAIGVGCDLMIGYTSRRSGKEKLLSVILPLFVSVSFLLIADIESPRAGLIRVEPQNLVLLSQSLGRK